MGAFKRLGGVLGRDIGGDGIMKGVSSPSALSWAGFG